MDEEIKCEVAGQIVGQGYNDMIGRVYKADGCAPAIRTCIGGNNELKIIEPILVGGIGEIDFGTQNRQGDRVYSADGVACALTAKPLGNAGGYSYLYQVDEHKISAMRGRNSDKPNDITTGSMKEKRLELGQEETHNTLTRKKTTVSC